MSDDLQTILTRFQKFTPNRDDVSNIPKLPGNYIICLIEGTALPRELIGIKPVMIKFSGLDVIYTGVSNNLRARDFNQHFDGNNAGRSTLRKSLGCLFDYPQIPRDKNQPDNGKTKFSEKNEELLSQWMHSNLVFFFYPNNSYDELETRLINYLNPPLNLSKNNNEENKAFRNLLSGLRTEKTSKLIP
jgi:hypothetical protein